METKETEFNYVERSHKLQRFDKRLIEHIVGLVEQGVPRRELFLRYGMSPHTLCGWLSKHGHKSHRKTYGPSQKRSVVRAVEGGMSIGEAAVVFDAAKSTISTWMKKFTGENNELSPETAIAMPKKTSNPSESEEIKALKRALEEANLKNRALNTLIDIAEEHLKIDIRKKSGAKQSPR